MLTSVHNIGGVILDEVSDFSFRRMREREQMLDFLPVFKFLNLQTIVFCTRTIKDTSKSTRLILPAFELGPKNLLLSPPINNSLAIFKTSKLVVKPINANFRADFKKVVANLHTDEGRFPSLGTRTLACPINLSGVHILHHLSA